MSYVFVPSRIEIYIRGKNLERDIPGYALKLAICAGSALVQRRRRWTNAEPTHWGKLEGVSLNIHVFTSWLKAPPPHVLYVLYQHSVTECWRWWTTAGILKGQSRIKYATVSTVLKTDIWADFLVYDYFWKVEKLASAPVQSPFTQSAAQAW